MSSRTKKISKNAQMEALHDKLDEFGTAMYWLTTYMNKYDLTKHYQAWVEAMGTDKELPNVLTLSDIKMNRDKDE